LSIFDVYLTPEEQRRKKIAELVYLIRFNNRVKEDEDYGRQTRIFAEDESFRYYEELLCLCGGDTQLVSSLLDQKDWFREKYEKKNKI